MKKRIVGLFFLLAFLVISVPSSFAVMEGLQPQQRSLAKVGEPVMVPLNAEVKDAVSVGGPVVVMGHVLKDVVSVGSSVYVRDTAEIGGDVVSIGGRVYKSPKAIVRGDIVEINVKQFVPAAAYVGKGKLMSGMAVFSLFNLVALLLVAALLIAFLTPQLGRISAKIESGVLKAFLWGLLFFILIIPVIILLICTIVGILLVPLFVIIAAAAVIFGHIAAGHLVGKKSLVLLRIYNRSMLTETLTGLIILWIIGLVPLVGCLVNAFFICCGFGAAVLTRFGTK